MTLQCMLNYPGFYLEYEIRKISIVQQLECSAQRSARHKAEAAAVELADSGNDREPVENLTGALISKSEADSCTTYNTQRTTTACWGEYGNLHALRHSRSRFIYYVIHHIASLRHRMGHGLLSCHFKLVVKVRSTK
jgi:hypothetical protein